MELSHTEASVTPRGSFGFIKILVGAIVLIFIWFSAHFVGHSTPYLVAFSERIKGSEVEGTKDGYYLVKYPFGRDIYYLDTSSLSGLGLETYAMSSHFLEGVDPDSFKILKTYYAQDKNNLYHRSYSVPLTGEVKFLDHEYLTNNGDIYYGISKLAGANLADFTIYNAEYSRSGATIFYRSEPVRAIRSGAFIKAPGDTTIPCNPLETPYDNDYTICKITPDGKDAVVTIDAQSFTIGTPDLPTSYAKDKNHVYYVDGYVFETSRMWVVEGVDVSVGKDILDSYSAGCRTFSNRFTSIQHRDGRCDYSKVSADVDYVRLSNHVTLSGTARGVDTVSIGLNLMMENIWNATVPVVNGRWEVPLSISNYTLPLGMYTLVVSTPDSPPKEIARQTLYAD